MKRKTKRASSHLFPKHKLLPREPNASAVTDSAQAPGTKPRVAVPLRMIFQRGGGGGGGGGGRRGGGDPHRD